MTRTSRHLFLIFCAAALPFICSASPPWLDGRVSFKRGAFVIENHNDFEWKHCEFIINPDDETVMFRLMDGRDMYPGDIVAIPAATFHEDYPATPYDPRTHPPLIMRVACLIHGHTVGQNFPVN